MTTVEVRSYSRNSGRIWWEIESGTRKGSSVLATASSFCGFAKEKSREIATDCGLAAPICAARERSSSPVGDLRISPSLAVRSLIPKRRSFATSGAMRSKKKSRSWGGGARAFALEQGVGANCRSVEQNEFACAVNFMKGFDDRLRGVGGCRKNFQ